MYKFLLADDERIIREGIEKMVEWEMLGIELIQAKDGLEAYSLTEEELPDAIITDVKMPGMDGLELIEVVREKYPNIEFVILSGYGEFKLASKAMQLGVKYFLLKPSDEIEITSVLKKVIEEIEQKRQKEDVLKKIKKNLDNVIPQVKEQFLRECIMDRSYKEDEKLNTLKLLNLNIERIRIILFKFGENFGFEEKFVLKGVSESILNSKIIFSTILEDCVLIMISPIDFNELMNFVKRIRQEFYIFYNTYLTVAISEEDNFKCAPLLYKEVKKYLEYNFYLFEDSIITKDDVLQPTSSNDTTFSYEQISLTVKSGNLVDVEAQINSFFYKLRSMKLRIDITKTYCLELYMAILRQTDFDKINLNISKTMYIQQFDNLNQIYDFILAEAKDIAGNNYEVNIRKYNSIIKTVIEYTDANINDENLSLSWLAQKILYINVDYLGKLFKKKTSQSYSNYILNRRINKAKELINEQADIKIYEIAEQVGYGNNPQYFSQVFKKTTGYSPSEYKKVYS